MKVYNNIMLFNLIKNDETLSYYIWFYYTGHVSQHENFTE